MNPVAAKPAVVVVPTPARRRVRTLTDYLADAAAVRNGTSRPSSVADPPNQNRFQRHQGLVARRKIEDVGAHNRKRDDLAPNFGKAHLIAGQFHNETFDIDEIGGQTRSRHEVG